MNSVQRHQRAFLNDQLQSLYAPLQLLVEQLRQLLLMPVMAEKSIFFTDLEKINTAAELIQQSLGALGVDQLDESALSRLRHDLRNHIGIVDGYCDILLEDCGDQQALSALSKLRQHSRAFQEQLEMLRFPAGDAEQDNDPIAKMFRSFKRGLSRDTELENAAMILVVDDNASTRELLAQQLQRKGYTVLEADGGKSCIETMRRALPDLVLLDLLMPDMNGYEVLQAVREDEQLRRIPVVVISGVQDEEGAIHCIDAGASDYLIKPVNATLLNARLSALLERKRWQDKEQEYLAELERSQKFIRRVFGRYLSDEIVERLLDQQDGLSLGGQRRQVTVLMADIRDFSSISQQLQPEACVALLINYLAVMAEIIQRYRGTVDELMGDGILAIFGAPVTEPDDCDRALACAVAMQRGIEEVNRRNREQNLPQIQIGIGLNTGEVVAGNIGSELRSKYGVVGHNVNLTSRIESCTVGGQILVSPSTLNEAKVEVVTGGEMTVALKGAAEELVLHDVLGVGLPYDLLLPVVETPLRVLSQPLELEVTLLSGKQLNESQSLRLNALAVRGQALLMCSEENISVPVDVSVQGLAERRCYGKLFALASGDTCLEGVQYQLLVSSMSVSLDELK